MASLEAPATAIEAAPIVTVQGGIYRGQLPPGGHDLRLDGTPVRVAGDGCYIIAFGRDAGPSAVLQWQAADGGPVTRQASIAAREWRVQSLPTLPTRPVPDAEFEARRPGELALIAGARTQAMGSDVATGWRQAFAPPADGPITGVYGSQRVLAGTPSAPHAGLDYGAPAGARVTAPAAGIIRLAQGPFTLEGNLVMIDHGMGLVSALLHLSRIDVKLGEFVQQGQPIGLVGATGRATGPHLHWSISWGDVRIDPTAMLAAR